MGRALAYGAVERQMSKGANTARSHSSPGSGRRGVGGGRHEAYPALNGRVKPDPLDFNGVLNGSLVWHLVDAFV